MLSPALVVFIIVSLFGVFCVFLSSGLMGMWIGLELGFFGFLPVLNGKTVGENEAAVKYFVIQSVGSGVMLVSFLLVCADGWLGLHQDIWSGLANFLLIGGFMVKLGVFPMHFWFPSVMSLSSWFSCFWLSVVQKVGPFWGISGLGLGSWLVNLFSFFLIMTSVVGAFGGLAQVQFRPLLAYSSLGQTGWMGLVAILSLDLFVVYISVYLFILGGLLWTLHLISSYSVSSMPGWSVNKGLLFWMFSGGFFMSLSGLPPLAGASLKMLGVLVIVGFYPIFLGILIFCSMISLYYYLSMFINSVVCLGVNSSKIYDGVLISNKVSLVLIMVMLINWVGGLPFFLIMGGLSV